MKPAEINKKHIDLYYALKKHGYLSNSPEVNVFYTILELFDPIIYRLIKQQLAENTSAQLRSIIKNVVTNQGSIRETTHANEYEEYLSSHEDSLVQLDTVYVDFGACQPAQLLDETRNAQEKSISIFNKTKSKIVIYWNESQTQPFKITPLTCDIPPMKSCSFRIKFEPVF